MRHATKPLSHITTHPNIKHTHARIKQQPKTLPSILIMNHVDGELQTAQRLRRILADIHTRPPTNPLHLAAYDGNIDAIINFADSGVNMETTDELGSTPLWYACVGEKVVIVALLTKKYGCSFDVPAFTHNHYIPIIYGLVKVGSLGGVVLACKNGATAPCKRIADIRLNYESIIDSIWYNHLEAFDLINTGIDLVNPNNFSTMTPLAFAIALGRKSFVKRIIKYSAVMPTGVVLPDRCGTMLRFDSYASYAEHMNQPHIAALFINDHAEILSEGEQDQP